MLLLSHQLMIRRDVTQYKFPYLFNRRTFWYRLPAIKIKRAVCIFRFAKHTSSRKHPQFANETQLSSSRYVAQVMNSKLHIRILASKIVEPRRRSRSKLEKLKFLFQNWWQDVLLNCFLQQGKFRDFVGKCVPLGIHDLHHAPCMLDRRYLVSELRILYFLRIWFII